MAVGQAFFSVNVAVGALITYGAYMPEHISIPRATVVIALADTGVALIMGLIIFPLVLSYGLTPGEGPGLVFITLPIAFGHLGGGELNMQTTRTEFVLALEVASATNGFEGSIHKFPFSWLSISRNPIGQGLLRAVEKDFGALGGQCGGHLAPHVSVLAPKVAFGGANSRHWRHQGR